MLAYWARPSNDYSRWPGGNGLFIPTAPRLVIAAVYRHLGEKMKLLWTAELKMNTVHVSDVCRGLWLLGTTGGESGEVYNMVDAGETSKQPLIIVSIIIIITYSSRCYNSASV